MLSRTATLAYSLCLALLLPAPLTAALSRQERVIAGSPNDSLEVRHLVLKGTNEEIGRALADIAQERYQVRLQPARDSLRTRATRRYIEKNYPILYDRMRGVAASYGNAVTDDAWDHSSLMFTELRAACSVVHLPPASMANGTSVVSRDYDYSTGSLTFGFLQPGMLHPTSRPYLIELHPDRGYASIAMVAYDLLSGVLDGMNSEGLTVTMAMDDELFTTAQLEPTYGPAAGLGVVQTMRLLLDTAANVEEAKETLLLTKQYYEYIPVHFLIADRFGNSFVWEYSQAHNKEWIIESPGKPLVMTNFSLNRHMDQDKPPSAETAKSVCRRYSFLADRMSAAPGSISEDFIRKTHRGVDAQAPATADQKRPPIRTFWHALYYPEQRRVKFSFYLRDEPLPDNKVHIARTDYLEFSLAPTNKAMTSSAVVAEPAPAVVAGSPIATFQSAGAIVNVERGRAVSISLEKVKDAAALLPRLATLPELRVVQLAGTNVTDGDLVHLSSLPALEQLGLKATKITDAALTHLGKLRLTGLNLAETGVTDAGLAQISQLTRLETINLSGLPITDAGLAHLARLSGITGLNLASTKITDAGLPHLKAMDRLTKLNVTKTAVTDAGVAAAKKFLPFWASIQR